MTSKKQTRDDAVEAIRERHLKHIEEISKNLEPLTEEQQEWLESKTGGQNRPAAETPRPQKMDSPEEWRKLLSEKYWGLKKTVDDNFPGLWFSLEFQLCVKSILNIKDCTLPFIGIILGRPGSQKTLGIEQMRSEKYTYYTDNFTAKAFVSHSTNVPKDKLSEIDMLPKIKNKLFMTPELGPTFAKKDDDIKEVIGIMTRIADGHGYWSDSGAQGGRGYIGEHMFTWIGAAVDIPHSVHKYMSNIGPKIYFYRVPKIQKNEKDYLEQLKGDAFGVKFKRVQQALTDYLRTFDKGPDLEFDKNANLLKMPWNAEKDDKASLKLIVKLGILLGHLRTYAKTWNTEHTQGTDYAYSIPQVEEPDRAMEQLRNLARAHAVLYGRNYITMDDIPITIKTVLSTASIERTTIFDLLLAYGGTLTTSQIRLSLNLHEHVAHRTMAELMAVGLVDMDEGEHSNSEIKITLKHEFKWFLSKQFKKLRQNFVPADYSEYLKRENEKVASRKNTPVSYQNNTDLYSSEGEHRGENSASKTLYECPRCSVRNADPSEITKHRISFHHENLEVNGG